MSIRSMTGFGRAGLTIGGVPHVVEIRAVNHRYLDLKLRVPRPLAGLEPQLRKRIGQTIQRGRVDVLVSSGAGDGDVGGAVTVNLALAAQVLAACDTLRDAVGGLERPSSDFVYSWPGVLQTTPAQIDDAELTDAVVPAIDAALAALVKMREAEGAALFDDLSKHLDHIAAERAAIEAEAPRQVAQYQTRLRSRIDDLLAGRDRVVDEGRLLHEVAIFAERSDIAEELARLGSHVEQFREQLGRSGPIGRRLDFLCQEMLREVNTIASKVQDAGLSAHAIELKARLEQLREQAQNVE